MVSSNYSILPSQNLLYHLYHTILHHSQHPNFYFPILFIKIIYLPNIYITLNFPTVHANPQLNNSAPHIWIFCLMDSRPWGAILFPPQHLAHQGLILRMDSHSLTEMAYMLHRVRSPIVDGECWLMETPRKSCPFNPMHERWLGNLIQSFAHSIVS